MTTREAATTWALDREIVLSRVFEFPRELVFRAWTDGNRLGEWFGPKGFVCETKAVGVATAGARWRFDLIAPTGQRFTNRIDFLEVKAPELLVFDHGADVDDDPGRFRVTLTFDAQQDTKTILTLRQLHPTKAQRDAKLGFGAVELGYQTLDKLAAHLRSL